MIEIKIISKEKIYEQISNHVDLCDYTDEELIGFYCSLSSESWPKELKWKPLGYDNMVNRYKDRILYIRRWKNRHLETQFRYRMALINKIELIVGKKRIFYRHLPKKQPPWLKKELITKDEFDDKWKKHYKSVEKTIAGLSRFF